MLNERSKTKNTPESTFYDSNVLAHARRRLVALVTQRESPVLVTGEPGTGKSVLLRRTIDALSAPDQSILLDNPRIGFQDVLDVLLKSLHIDKATSAVNVEQLRSLDFVRWCLRKESVVQEHYVTLFMDEAHDLGTDVLIELVELAQRSVTVNPFFGLVLAGTPALERKLAQPALRDLLRTKFIHFRLRPLSPEETGKFMRHYFLAMGIQNAQLISFDAVTRIWMYSRGAMDLIERLCYALLAVAKKQGIDAIDLRSVKEAAALCALKPGVHGDAVDSTDAGDRRKAKPRTAVASDAPADHTEPESPTEQDTPSEPEHPYEPESTGERAPARAHERVGLEKQPATPSKTQERPMDRTTSLNTVLKNLQTGSPDVEASALITEDGLTIASALPQDLDETRVAGMSATLLNLGTRAASELGRGDVREVIVRGEHGYTVMISAGRGVLLLSVANERAKLGLIFFDMREAINAIKRIL